MNFLYGAAQIVSGLIWNPEESNSQENSDSDVIKKLTADLNDAFVVDSSNELYSEQKLKTHLTIERKGSENMSFQEQAASDVESSSSSFKSEESSVEKQSNVKNLTKLISEQLNAESNKRFSSVKSESKIGLVSEEGSSPNQLTAFNGASLKFDLNEVENKRKSLSPIKIKEQTSPLSNEVEQVRNRLKSVKKCETTIQMINNNSEEKKVSSPKRALPQIPQRVENKLSPIQTFINLETERQQPQPLEQAVVEQKVVKTRAEDRDWTVNGRQVPLKFGPEVSGNLKIVLNEYYSTHPSQVEGTDSEDSSWGS